MNNSFIILIILMIATSTLCILYTRYYLHHLFESFIGAPIDQKIGEYDNVKKTNCPESLWRHSPSNESLLEKNIFTPQGHTMPLEPVFSEDVDMGINLNDTESKPQSFFMFANNVCKPECCPSTYTCSNGCVCTNKQQRDFLTRRGNNKNFSENSI